MASSSEERSPQLLGGILKDFRDSYHLSQEELAADLHVDVRTLRRWENGETILSDVNELQRLADRLHIESERLGVLSTLYAPEKPEHVDEVVSSVWELVSQARNTEAKLNIERLVREARNQRLTDNPAFLRPLAHAYHSAGYIVAMSTRTNEVSQAIYYFEEMVRLARQLGDDTLLDIALTYHGDMLRRRGDVEKAIDYLKAAADLKRADAAARGNGIQLLARACLRAQDVRSFENYMAEATDLVLSLDPNQPASTYGQYNLGTVYEEYGKSYGILGNNHKALDYLDKAEEALPRIKFWEILLMIARSEILIRSADLDNGLPLAVEAARWCRMYGQYRRLERIYALKRWLNQHIRRFAKAEMALGEVLEGPIED
jgi:transcriptional regulator with XRE-family HTH domain